MLVLIVLFVLPIDIHYEEAALQMYHFLFVLNIPIPFLCILTMAVFSKPVYTTNEHKYFFGFENTLLRFMFRILIKRQFADFFGSTTTTHTNMYSSFTTFRL